ncbi:MAG: PAS domain-containing sensor histidine kinase, partial [Desulfovibrionales bacterium]
MVEQALQKSQEKYWKIFRSNPSFLLLSTLKEGKFLEINPAFEEITGYSRKELLDSSAFELNIWADWSQRERLVAKLLEQGSFTDEEMDLRTKSGDIRSVSISCEYMELDGERHIVMAGTDITERKQMEKALRDLADELEHRVRERTIELERANRAKDDFLANMSHELRTPLSGILGLTDVLLDHVPDQASRSDLSLIRYSADSALVLLNDILDLTRIEQGKIELHPLEFDLEEMVSNIARPFEIQAQEKGLGFDVVVDETLPDRFRGDPDRLGQVLKNLLSNAVKFTKSGSVRLMIDKDRETDHLARIRFTVADTGIGIPEGKIE